jgi:hypothetical protein
MPHAFWRSLRIVALVGMSWFLSLVPAQGTLVLLLPTRVGIVACADRREWNRIEGAKDVDKIFPVGQSTAFIIVGNEALSIPQNGNLKRVYSLAGSVRKFYSHHPFSGTNSGWNELAEFLKKDFETAYRDQRTAIEISPSATDDVVWEIDFLYLQNQKPAIQQIEYHLGGALDVAALPRKPYITGQTDVTLRILRPQQFHDSRFSDLWGQDLIRRVWNGFAAEYPANVTVQDALVFSHTFIRASAERMHLVNSGPDLVGPTCDCFLIGERSGLKWLQRSVDTRTAGLSLPH